MMNGIGWGMDGSGWIWLILVSVLVLALIRFFAPDLRGRDRSPTDDAAATLRSRFARGEMTTEEYEPGQTRARDQVKENVMTTNRVHLIGGAILTGALLLGTAGLSFAQDPTAAAAPNGTGHIGFGIPAEQGMMTGAQRMTADQRKTMARCTASMTADQSLSGGHGVTMGTVPPR